MAEKEDKVLELLDQLKEKYGKFLDDTASEAGDGSGLHFDLTSNNVISKDEIYIEALYIKPEHQGKGIGKEIVDELKKLSNEINVPITLVDFSKEGVEGVSFWEQLGFYDAADTGEGDGTIYRPDTPTNVVDEVSELQDALRNKYKNELDELYIIKRPFYDPIKEINTQNGIFIEEIILKPKFRGSGVGTKIVDDIKKFATENNYGIELEPVRGQNAVIRFWENQGFKLQEYFDDKGNLITDNKELNNVYKWTPDTPGGSLGAAKLNDPLVFDSWVDNYAKTTTSFVDNLPLSTTVKNQFNNLVQGRARNLATPGGIADAVDVWELGVLGLMIAAVAYKEYDEIPTILTNKAIDMFNSMTSSYGIPPVPKEEYDLDYEFINKVVETGEKFMPTDIIIKKVGDVVKGAAETGAVTGFGYVPPNLTKTDTMETTQKIQPGVQEEKMFEQARPKKNRSGGGGGSGVKIL